MAYVVSLVKEIARKRRLIWDLSKADFKKRFVGSYFGVVWMFVQPMVTVFIFLFFRSGLKMNRRFPERRMCSGWCRELYPGFFSVKL